LTLFIYSQLYAHHCGNQPNLTAQSRELLFPFLMAMDEIIAQGRRKIAIKNTAPKVSRAAPGGLSCDSRYGSEHQEAETDEGRICHSNLSQKQIFPILQGLTSSISGGTQRRPLHAVVGRK